MVSLDQVLDVYGKNLKKLGVEGLNRRKQAERNLLPRKGIWRDCLIELARRFGTGTFTSKDLPRGERHILTKLSIDYRALLVVERVQGRQKIYQINPVVLSILTVKGEEAASEKP